MHSRLLATTTQTIYNNKTQYENLLIDFLSNLCEPPLFSIRCRSHTGIKH